MSDTPIPLRLTLPFVVEGAFLAAFASSLARGGVFVATRSPEPTGTLIAFEFVLADGTPVLVGRGMVVESRPASEGARPGMTLRFTQLDEQSHAFVDRAIELLRRRSQAAPPSATGSAQDAAGEPSRALVGAKVAEVTGPPPVAAGDRRRGRTPILEGPCAQPSLSGADPILGIDLGTTHCRAAICVDGEVKLIALEDRVAALPSIVALDERGRPLLGSRAKARLLVDPGSALFGFKRLLGRRASSARVRALTSRLPWAIVADESGDAAFHLRDQVLTPAKAASFLLAEVRRRASEVLGRSVERAVIAAPACFDDRQRRAVRLAGELAGLKVERVLSEPLAVGIAFGHRRSLARKRLLVCDLGGGVFDASVLAATGNEIEVLATFGDPLLGGLDFDERIARLLERRFLEGKRAGSGGDPPTLQRLREAAESAKIALSESPETRVRVPWTSSQGGVPLDLDLALDRPGMEGEVGDLVDRAIAISRAVLESRGLTPQGIDEVLAVGGQSLSPLVRRALEAFLGRPVQPDLDPTEAVAVGAALLGQAMRDEGRGLFSLRASEVLCAPIGIGLSGGRLARVLDRNTPLPVEKLYTVPSTPGAPVRLAIYQGDAELAEETEYLGVLTIDAAARGELGVVFSVSRDGVLSLTAHAPDGTSAASAFATADVPPEQRPALLASAPPALAPETGLFNGLKRLFKR
jgi:molecular chaperone DnaK